MCSNGSFPEEENGQEEQIGCAFNDFTMIFIAFFSFLCCVVILRAFDDFYDDFISSYFLALLFLFLARYVVTVSSDYISKNIVAATHCLGPS